MRKAGLVVLMLSLLALLGCEPVVSLNPLIKVEEGLVLPGLAGCWTESPDDTDCGVTFQETQGRSYRIVLAEDHGVTEFHGRVAPLGEDFYLDITPVRFEEESSEGARRILTLGDPDSIGKMHLLAGHTFYRLRIDGDTLSLNYLTRGWASEQAKAGALSVSHSWITVDGSKELILTAPTEDLQDFVRRQAATPSVFESLDPLYRRKDSR